MLITKKPGPPVPPRPRVATILAANNIEKSKSTSAVSIPSIPTQESLTISTTAKNNGRTIIYKSPSLDMMTNTEKFHQSSIIVVDDSSLNTDNVAVIHNSKSPFSSHSTRSCHINNDIPPALNEQVVAELKSTACPLNLNNSVTDTDDYSKTNNNINTEIIILKNNDNIDNNNIIPNQSGNDPSIHFKNNLLISEQNIEKPEEKVSNGYGNANNNAIKYLNSLLTSEEKMQMNNKCENIQDIEIKQKSPAPRLRLTTLFKQKTNIPNDSLVDIDGPKVSQHNFNKKYTIDTDVQLVRSQPVIERNSEHLEETSIGNICSQDCTNIEIDIQQNVELKNNYRNSVDKFKSIAEKLLTEIILKSSSNNSMTDNVNIVENLSKFDHCIKVETSSISEPITTSTDSINVACMEKNNSRDRTNMNNESNLTMIHDNKSIDNQKNNNNTNEIEKKVTFHEILISELTAMHQQDDIDSQRLFTPFDTFKRPRYPSSCSTDDSTSPSGTHRGTSRIRTADWIEVGDNGKEVVLSSCQISLEDSGLEDEERLDDLSLMSNIVDADSWDNIKHASDQMSLPGLPPLPKSLSGAEETGVTHHQHQHQQSHYNHHNSSSGYSSIESQRASSLVRKHSTLDTQLAILRREMFGLRQLDHVLLSKLWALNESIQEFRTIIQEQETLSPPSPSPSPSDVNSVSSGDDDGDPSTYDSRHSNNIHHNSMHQQQHYIQQQQHVQQQRMRAAPPPPPNRKASSRPV